jgi:hypothetical protein
MLPLHHRQVSGHNRREKDPPSGGYQGKLARDLRYCPPPDKPIVTP